MLKREGLGLGDAKLLALIGALLGWRSLLFVLAVGGFAGSLISIPIAAVARRRQPAADADESLRHTQIPFGPFLAGAALAYVFLGPAPVRSCWLGLRSASRRRTLAAVRRRVSSALSVAAAAGAPGRAIGGATVVAAAFGAPGSGKCHMTRRWR